MLMDGVGPPGFLWVLAIGHAAIFAFALYRMTRRKSPAVKTHPVFPATPIRRAGAE
jgi:hypothetical protein